MLRGLPPRIWSLFNISFSFVNNVKILHLDPSIGGDYLFYLGPNPPGKFFFTYFIFCYCFRMSGVTDFISNIIVKQAKNLQHVNTRSSRMTV